MKAHFKNSIKNFALIFLALMTMFICGCGCNTSKPTPDPLVGFHIDALHTPDSNKAIADDYHNYIRTLTPEEQKYIDGTTFYEDGTGQHAVVIEVDLQPTAWNHVLIYDKDYKRIKVVKYISFHYRS